MHFRVTVFFRSRQAASTLVFIRSAFLSVLELHSIEIHGTKCVWESCWKTLTLWQAILLSSIGEPDALQHGIYLQLRKISHLFTCSDDDRTDTQLPLLVTASVDAIHLRRRLDLSKDVQVSGQVVWTGKSAMDIRMQLTQARTARHAPVNCRVTLMQQIEESLVGIAMWKSMQNSMELHVLPCMQPEHSDWIAPPILLLPCCRNSPRMSQAWWRFSHLWHATR